MYSKNGSATVGARSFAITITMTVALTAASAGAETIATINGANIDSSVLEVYVQSLTMAQAYWLRILYLVSIDQNRSQKKVGVPADLDLESTLKKMRGLEKPPLSD